MKKIVVVVYTIVMIPVLLLAQSTKIDSLKSRLLLVKTDSSKVMIYKNISWIYLNNRNDGDLAKSYIDSVYIFSENADLNWGISLANYQYCVYERQKGNYDLALSYIEKYLSDPQIKKEANSLANGLYQKAIILHDKGKPEESLEIYHEILTIYEDREDAFSIGTIQNAIGEILKETGKVEEALVAYNKALDIFTRIGDKIELANVNYNLGDTYMKLKDYDKALAYFNKAFVLDQELKSEWGMAYDLTSLGKVANLKGDHEKALNYLLQALKLRKKLKQKRELALSYNELGKTYLKLNKFTQAEEYLIESAVIAENIGVKTELKDAYASLSNLYKKTGDYKKALDFNSKFITVKDSLYNEIKSRQIEELQVKFDLAKKQDEINSLEKDAEINDLKLKRQGTLRNIIIGITLSTILFSFILFRRYQYRQRQKRDEQEKKQLLAKAEAEKERVLELQKVDKLKDEFLANTSHELRTPLTGIIGLTESLKDGIAGNLPNEAIENLDLIASSGKRLSHLVNDILDFSKLKNKDLTLNVNPVDVYAIANIVVKLSRPLIQSKKVDLYNNVPKNLALVNADENRLQQILYNLIGNAIKFTESGTIEVSAKGHENTIEIIVSDTGVGIPKEKYENVFKAFEQGDGSIVREKGGTGLGLTVSKQLVELHGGNLSFVSEVGKGTTFRFTLQKSSSKRVDLGTKTSLYLDKQMQQIQSNTKSEEISESPYIISSPKSIKVLVVDDEYINRKVLQNQLSLAGYFVKVAVDGKEALSFFKQGDRFDLVILDIMMPGMSGYEVCEAIRKKYSASELPIVLLTAKNRVSDLVYGFNVGANDYLTKPFSKNELLSRIKTHVNLKNIHKATSKFIPVEFLKSIDKDAITDIALGDYSEKEVTVLFTDIRGYTKLAESMTPAQNFKFVNAYAGRMGPLIQQNRGFVNQYLGDGIMALFPYKPYHALQAAIDMQKKIITYNKKRKLEGYAPLSVGMGLHTGPLVMGIIGDVKRNDTAIIADTVNTAARMEGLAKYYGANIIVSENSLLNIGNKDQYNLRSLGKVQAKGKDKIIDIYECFDGDGSDQIQLKKETITEFEKGVKLFFNKNFDDALEVFNTILKINKEDKVVSYFAHKSEQYLEHIADDWDGVNMMTTK